MLYYINWPDFILWLLLLLEIFSNMCTAIICFPVYHVINFEIKLISLSSRFSTWSKIQDKNLDISRTKRTFKVKKKRFPLLFKDLQLPKIVSDLGVCLKVQKTLCIFVWLVRIRGKKPMLRIIFYLSDKHRILFIDNSTAGFKN